ncbi:redox-sensing transcriptional repressor Rex [Prosthecobacter sp.]|jgi:redox-sensing transcriptional repressor|uniref:redox-sensing transcriptional repressor Rex n=1 Tax=Prosthecobacter sp. TaxID=1965333 RepID=UPI0024881068|nr:redox-sensing transcriptional repressor Rex [Prosthecobacter sp.]MDI1312669.1 redox-sensing transcriptional repressor Rex [Prosthecobacter sp.]
MPAKIDIPRKSIYRLSIYQRCLQRLRENQVDTVSSAALAKAAGVKSTQLRKDLAYFGQLGTRGLGYNVDALSGTIGDVLGQNKLQPVILVGVGNLGSALLRYGGFRKEGFEVAAAFDLSPRKLPQVNVPVLAMTDMAEFIRRQNVKMAILTVPASNAQSVVNDLVQHGIQAILNFSPTVLDVPEHVVVNSVDLAVELENLSYFIR